MERITKFIPAYDERNNPKGNYGIHGVDLRMYLKGELGTVQFVVYTNWYLPHVQEELIHRNANDELSIRCMFTPQPADVGYHSPKPMYEGQEPMTDSCECLDGKPCYYDGSGLYAEEIYKVLVEKGSDGVWKDLENYYVDVFGELK
jgi:hypothetical protein